MGPRGGALRKMRDQSEREERGKRERRGRARYCERVSGQLGDESSDLRVSWLEALTARRRVVPEEGSAEVPPSGVTRGCPS